jgi:serine/threonine-protein kinase
MRTPISTRLGHSGAHLPQELVSEQIQRLWVFSAVIGGLWGFGLVMDLIVVPWILRAERHSTAIGIETAGLVIAGAMFAYARFANAPAGTKASAGLAFMIVNAVGVALLNASFTYVLSSGPQVSWNAVLILVYSMISSAGPRRLLLTSLVAASMDPLVAWLAHLRGLPALPPLAAFLHYLPNYVCAMVAVVAAGVLHRLGHRLHEAQELGTYRLVEPLGKGGMGEVWRAEHRLLARSAAIKLVRPEVLGAGIGADPRLVLRRFEREARATAALSSPHTIRVFDFGATSDGAFYYVMELLSGRDLESLIREFGPVEADRALYLLRQVCHSLAEAHARGLVHRDIKPANIYVCRMGLDYDFVKVLDFGLVTFRGRSDIQALEHQTTGTPAYMAPEIILGEADIDRRADVYALGCVMYYLLTGQLVFEGETPMKVLMQHIHDRPIPPSQRTELPVPPEIDRMVLACLEKDPNRRPQNAEELLSLSLACRSCEQWNQTSARRWWEIHLPELTLQMTVTEEAADGVGAMPGEADRTGPD